MRWNGTATLNGGTGRYHGLTGNAVIGGYMFCFAAEGCAAKGGKFLDGQLVIEGNYRDPTPELSG